jgi:hypothetical protein
VNDEQTYQEKGWRVALVAYFATRLPLLLFAGLINYFRPATLRDGHFLYHGGAAHDTWWIDAFQRWDAYWFLNIVREGYHFHGPVEQVSDVVAGIPETNVTPFPLYPALMSAGEWLLGDAALAGLVISQIFMMLAMVWLYQLIQRDRGADVAKTAVWFFAVFPWGYAFSAIYSESLFFALSIGAVLAVRKGRPGLGGIAGLLAALTRMPGLLIAIPMAIEILRDRDRSRWQLGFVLLVPMGTLLYFGYLWQLTGEPFAYFIGQQGWHKELVPLWYHPLRWVLSPELGPETYLEVASAAFMGAILIAGWRRLRWSYWFYLAASFALLMSSSYLLGLPRYCAALFPMYIALAEIAQRKPAVGQAILLVSAMISPAVFWVWTTWRYAF